MELAIALRPGGNATAPGFQGLAHLKNYLERGDIEGLESITAGREPATSGTQGLGILLGSLTAVISAASGPLTELVKCLQVYVQNMRQEVEINVNGKSIHIKANNVQKTESLVKAILEAAGK